MWVLNTEVTSSCFCSERIPTELSLQTPLPQVEKFTIWLILLMAYGDPGSDVGLGFRTDRSLGQTHPHNQHLE